MDNTYTIHKINLHSYTHIKQATTHFVEGEKRKYNKKQKGATVGTLETEELKIKTTTVHAVT